MQELFRASTLSGFPFSPLFLLPSKSFRLVFLQSGILSSRYFFSRVFPSARSSLWRPFFLSASLQSGFLQQAPFQPGFSFRRAFPARFPFCPAFFTLGISSNGHFLPSDFLCAGISFARLPFCPAFLLLCFFLSAGRFTDITEANSPRTNRWHS